METTATAEAPKKKSSTLEALLERKSRPIQFTVVDHNKLPGSRWRYEVKIDDAQAAELLEEVVKEFSKAVRVPGFRPGKAPAHLVRNYFDGAAREEVVKRVTPRLVELIAEQNHYDILGQPVLMSYKSDKEHGTQVELAFEVRPVVTVSDDTFRDLAVEATEYVVDDSVVDRAIERLRVQAADYLPAPADYGYQKGDGILIDCTAYMDGHFVEEMSDTGFYTTEVEKFLPAEVVDQLVGHKRGETIEANLTHTHKAQHEGMAEATEHSHTTTFIVTLNEIKRRQLPELDDEFAKDVNSNVSNLAELRTHVRTRLEEEARTRTRNEALARVFNALGERVPFELPQALLNDSFRSKVQNVEKRLRAQKMTLNQVTEQQRKMLLDQMANNTAIELRNHFLSAAITKEYKIEPTQEQIDARLDKVAADTGRKRLSVLAGLEKNKMYGAFVDEIRAELVNDFLLGKATITYKKSAEAPSAGAGGEDAEGS